MERETKQVLIWRKDLVVRKGKIAAQIAHASVGALLKSMDTEIFYEGAEEENEIIGYRKVLDFKPNSNWDAWINGVFKKIVVGIENEELLVDLYNKAEEIGMPCCLIKDSGLTEFNNVPTITCCAIGPYWSDEIDELTSHLKLL